MENAGASFPGDVSGENCAPADQENCVCTIILPLAAVLRKRVKLVFGLLGKVFLWKFPENSPFLKFLTNSGVSVNDDLRKFLSFHESVIHFHSVCTFPFRCLLGWHQVVK